MQHHATRFSLGLKKICQSIASNNLFGLFILVTILINALAIGLETYKTLSQYSFLFYLINIIALIIFILEAGIKIISVYPEIKQYFFNPWDAFDFIVIILALIPGIGPLATIARLSRLFRILRLVRQFKEMKLIIDSLLRALPSISNVLILLVIIFYGYGVLGVHLFSSVDSYRWGTLGSSILTLFTIVTLTNWDVVFYKALASNPYAWIYFFSFVFLGSMLVINLFVGIMVYNITNTKKEQTTTNQLIEQNKKILSEIQELKRTIKKK